MDSQTINRYEKLKKVFAKMEQIQNSIYTIRDISDDENNLIKVRNISKYCTIAGNDMQKLKSEVYSIMKEDEETIEEFDRYANQQADLQREDSILNDIPEEIRKEQV